MRDLRCRLVAVLTLGTWLSAGLNWAEDRKKAYDALALKAQAAERAFRWDEALELWQRAHTASPSNVTPMYGCAAASARKGLTEVAFGWLDVATAHGFTAADYAQADGNLSSLRGDSRWNAVIAKITKNATDAMLEVQEPREAPDSSGAPAFTSYKRLKRTFDRQSRALQAELWRMSARDGFSARLKLERQRIAAANRYVREHATAKDRPEAAWEAASRVVLFLGPYILRTRWEAAREFTHDLDSFISAYPESFHVAEARMLRAFSEFHARLDPGPNGSLWSDADLRVLDQSLDGIARDFVGETTAGEALVWRLILANLGSSAELPDEVFAIRSELENVYPKDRAVQELLSTAGREATIRMDGIGSFKTVDTTGTTWTNAALSGKVTLINFWATWCGPCVLELPTLQRAWASYRDQGFQILGVMLDTDSPETLKSWMEANQIGWPQIWDGRGWDSALVHRFRVRSVPFEILLDKTGRVASVGLRGNSLVAKIAALVGENIDDPKDDSILAP